MPGAPSMRTTLPRGIPPSKISSSPSTKVLTRGDRVSACFGRGAAFDLGGWGAVASSVNAFSISSRMPRSAVVSGGLAGSVGVAARAEATDDAVGAGLGPNFDSSSCRFTAARRWSGRSSSTFAKLFEASARFWSASKTMPRSTQVSTSCGWRSVARSKTAAAAANSSSMPRTRPSPIHPWSSFGLSSRARR